MKCYSKIVLLAIAVMLAQPGLCGVTAAAQRNPIRGVCRAAPGNIVGHLRPAGPTAFGSATERTVHTRREEIREVIGLFQAGGIARGLILVSFLSRHCLTGSYVPFCLFLVYYFLNK